MKCIHSAVVLTVALFWATRGSTAFAQVTAQEALQAANDAGDKIKTAVNAGKGSASAALANRISDELVQIGRVLFNYNQFTAMERSSFGGHIADFWNAALPAYSFYKDANADLETARSKWLSGFWDLVTGSPGSAKTYFDDAKTAAESAKDRYDTAFLDSLIMQGKVNALKTAIDAALN